MTGWIVKLVVGVVLFVGSLVGGLAATGRLDHAGTANIPLLHSFFPAPPAADQDPGAQHAAPNGETAANAPAPIDPVGDAGPRRQKSGRSVTKDDKSGGSAGAHGAATEHDTEHGDAAPAAAKDGEATAPAPATVHREPAARSPEADFQKLASSLQNGGKGEYEPGEYFRFDGMPAGLTPDQINDAWQRVQGQLSDIDKRRTALELREQELQELADDFSRRQAALGTLRVDVEQMQRQLDARIEKFQQQVKLVRNDEAAALKRNAQTLASFEPSKAAELVQEQWKSERGQDEVVKLLEFMDKDAVNTLLAVLPTAMTQDLLKKRLRVTKEPAPSAKPN
jgi:hypothetical protein